MSAKEIIALWPSASEFARDIGLRRATHATVMQSRGSIPAAYWSRVVAAAKARGIPGITYETLASIAASRSSSPSATTERGAA